MDAYGDRVGADANACLHWLAADRPDLDSVREALAAIVNDGNRAGEVITRIRTLLARSSVAHGPCDLTAVIRDVLPFVGREIGRHEIKSWKRLWHRTCRRSWAIGSSSNRFS